MLGRVGITPSTPSRIRDRPLGSEVLLVYANEVIHENVICIRKEVNIRRPICRVLVHQHNQGRHSMNQHQHWGQRVGQRRPFPITAWQRRRVNSRNEPPTVTVLILQVQVQDQDQVLQDQQFKV
jgi:hypothetical protein